MGKRKGFSEQQQKALALLTCGKGLTYTAIAEEINVDRKTLWRWLNEPQYASFQQELDKINDERWKATVDAARAAAVRLIEKDNQKMVEFVLRTEGYNPTQKVEAEINTDINIIIEE